MNASDFTPEFSPEQIAFISARRYFTFLLFRLLPMLRLKGFPECTSDYQILGPEGVELSEANQYQLDGQSVEVRFRFSHQEKNHYFSVIFTNGEHWELMITLRSSVASDVTLISGIETEDLDTAYLNVSQALLSTVEDVRNGRVTKTRTVVLPRAPGSNAGLREQVESADGVRPRLF